MLKSLALVIASVNALAIHKEHHEKTYLIENGINSLAVEKGEVVLLHTGELQLDYLHKLNADPDFVLEQVGGEKFKICLEDKKLECLGVTGEDGRIHLVNKKAALEFSIEKTGEINEEGKEKLIFEVQRRGLKGFLCSRMTFSEETRFVNLGAFIEEDYQEGRCSFVLIRTS